MADLLDLVTLDEAKRAINMQVTTASSDDVLAQHITAVSRIVDDTCGPVVRRTVTAEMHDGGRRIISLRRWPVVSLTLVREARMGGVETLTEVPFGGSGDGYFAPAWERDPAMRSGVLHRRRFGCDYTWWPGSGTVEATYLAGRAATTVDVDARFKDAAGSILRRLWKREAGAWAQSSEFFESLGDADNATPGSGFFKVAKPIIDEMLWDHVQTHLVGIA